MRISTVQIVKAAADVGRDWPADVSRAREAGYDGIEVWFARFPTEAIAESMLAAAGSGESAGADSTGFCGLSLPLAEGDCVVAAGMLRPWLKLCRQLGMRRLSLQGFPGGMPPGSPVMSTNVSAHPVDAAVLGSALYQILQEIRFDAEQAGTVVAVEAGPASALLGPIAIAELVDEANSWVVAAGVDAAVEGGLQALAGWLRTLRQRVRSLRIGEALAGEAEGAMVREWLAEIDFDGVLLCSTPQRPAWTMGFDKPTA